MTIETTIDTLGKKLAAMRVLNTRQVLVGIPGDKAQRKLEPGSPPQAINNAALGYIHENGSPAANIPARPFLAPGINNAMPDILKAQRAAADAALEGNSAGVEKNLIAMGLIAQAAVRLKLTQGPFIPLAPRTLAERRARGRSGTSPLLDTGQLRAAINFVIRNR
jgi:hypothetical protein